ncbi:hypothetical protein BKA67DRAFT_540117 [Truncatella angustata]|uniref:F-box domain-containing protein n=1 Tax=Truncatella angustata TaxID=152316 RepID=A0A9P8UCE9_9PEZI|nr:uncharacterized protein BKA67DRAFT_540117 [Truncatella angustata]KAH6646611.1 hypothetical protein BKA67DRAFT_540117 [Truncatella angustata]
MGSVVHTTSAFLPELLVVILLELDVRTLSLAQGVNRQFYSTSINTKTLRRRLFFPTDDAVVTAKSLGERGRAVRNPPLAELFPAWPWTVEEALEQLPWFDEPRIATFLRKGYLLGFRVFWMDWPSSRQNFHSALGWYDFNARSKASALSSRVDTIVELDQGTDGETILSNAAHKHMLKRRKLVAAFTGRARPLADTAPGTATLLRRSERFQNKTYRKDSYWF